MIKTKFYHRALALGTAVGITLFSGCSGKNDSKEIKDSEAKLNGSMHCRHQIVEFADQTVILRECEGYKLKSSISVGIVTCTAYKEEKESYNNEDIIFSICCARERYSAYNLIHTTTDTIDKMEQELIDKGAYVYTLK